MVERTSVIQSEPFRRRHLPHQCQIRTYPLGLGVDFIGTQSWRRYSARCSHAQTAQLEIAKGQGHTETADALAQVAPNQSLRTFTVRFRLYPTIRIRSRRRLLAGVCLLNNQTNCEIGRFSTKTAGTSIAAGGAVGVCLLLAPEPPMLRSLNFSRRRLLQGSAAALAAPLIGVGPARAAAPTVGFIYVGPKNDSASISRTLRP